MHGLREAAVSGFNKFITEQRKLEGKAEVSLIIFDDVIETVFSGVDLNEVKLLTQDDFKPRGSTALYDALGFTITNNRATSAEDTQTIVAVMTDGAENASREFTQSAVAALIKDVEATLGWETIFIGANINASHVSAGLNIKGANTVQFCASASGMESAYTNLSRGVGAYRSGDKSFSYDTHGVDSSATPPPV